MDTGRQYDEGVCGCVFPGISTATLMGKMWPQGGALQDQTPGPLKALQGWPCSSCHLGLRAQSVLLTSRFPGATWAEFVRRDTNTLKNVLWSGLETEANTDLSFHTSL